MQLSSNIAFKEWAVVVDALGAGEQILLIRKGGIREEKGQFQLYHREFWLFPTQFHESEQSVIPSKRPTLQELAKKGTQDHVDVEYYAIADPIFKIQQSEIIDFLQGKHILSQNVLRERFEFGRENGFYAIIARVYRLPQIEKITLREEYSGCKSWIELDRSLSTNGLVPVIPDREFEDQRNELVGLFNEHAVAHL